MSLVVVDDRQLVQALQHLKAAGQDMTPAMRKIAQAMSLIVEDNFEAEGQPKWKALSDVTVALRTKAAKGKTEGGFRILQDAGQLAGSIATAHSSDHATIGSNLVYAAIHQFGGMAGRGKKVEIPARPFLPITADGKLQPEASEEVLDTVMRHLRTAVLR